MHKSIDNNTYIRKSPAWVLPRCLWHGTLFAGVCAVMSGCGLVDDPLPGGCETDVPQGYKVGIVFSAPDNSGKMTRAPYGSSDDAGHDQASSYFPDMFENAVNPYDAAVYIFAKTGNAYNLIYDSTTDDRFRILGSPWSGYNVASVIPFGNYELNLTELNESSTVGLRVVVIANQHTDKYGQTNPGKYPAVAAGTSYIEAMSAISDAMGQYTIPENWNPGNTYEQNLPRYIPMFGQADVTVNALELYHSESWQTVSLSDIWMLRAMTKVEINDNIDRKEATDDRYPQIVSARLAYRYTSGWLMPAGYSDYVNGTQVESPNLGASGVPVTKEMTMVRGTYYGDSEQGRRVRFMRGYCPEQTIESGYPNVEITIKPSANATEAEYSTYTVPLSGYNGSVFNWGTGDRMLRNHIYRISVNSVGTPADITVQVLPWEGEEIVWDYTDNPGFAENGYIMWDEGSYNSIDPATARVYVKPVTDGPVVCRFTMVQPQDATWRAYLIDTEGQTQGAFHFVDESGATIDVPEGKVGEEAVLRILPSQTAQQYTNAARLQILVTTADGSRKIIADVLNGNYGKNAYFTIVQSGTGM